MVPCQFLVLYWQIALAFNLVLIGSEHDHTGRISDPLWAVVFYA